MEVIIKPNYKALSRHAASIIAEQVREKPDSVLGLATGSTPLGMYQELVKMHEEESLDFSHVTTFNLDEYWPLAPEHPQSYAKYMEENFFRHTDINPKNSHIPSGEVKKSDIKKYCAWYEKEIKKRGGIDIQILGIGADGHIGFNEPGSSKRSRTRLEKLDSSTIQANWEKFWKKQGFRIEHVPHYAITMGIGTILEAKRILLLASGAEKAMVVARAIEGRVTSQITSSYLQTHKDFTVLLDEAAASKLSRYKRYKHD